MSEFGDYAKEILPNIEIDHARNLKNLRREKNAIFYFLSKILQNQCNNMINIIKNN